MKLNNYETIYILKPNIAEDTNLKLISRYKSIIKENGGRNILIQHRGRRHLSYNIMEYYDGIYIQINYDGNGDIVKVLEKSMRFSENILRYLTTKNNSKNNIKL